MSTTQPAPATGIPAEEPVSALQRLETILGESMLPPVTQARLAFRRDLPQLLKEYPDGWVAYHGDSRVAVGKNKTVLFQQCLNNGCTPGNFLVLRIEPVAEQEVDMPIDV